MIVRNTLIFKFISFLFIVRWYNILFVMVAQYFSAFSIIQKNEQNLYQLINNFKLHFIVLATLFSIAAGFIINNFYDFDKDLINRPKPTLFSRLVSKNTSLNIYALFNVIALIVAFMASIKVFIFFVIFISAIWFYSHKIEKIPFLKELFASLLSVAPFFAVMLHYNIFTPFIYVFGLFFMTLVYSRELIKQFQNFNGDKLYNILSIPVYIGFDKAHYFTYFILTISSIIGLSILLFFETDVYKFTFFILSIIINIVCANFLSKENYKIANNLLKICIGLGIISLLFS